VFIVTAAGEETGPLTGRGEIGEFYGARLARRQGFRRHLTTNLIIEREDDRTASTRAFLALVADREGRFETLATGTYRDELRLEDDGRWRISARRIFLETPEIPAP
jgi:3-phenylpropionate/cinnamic acid dioxygenase small subunit